MKTVQDLTSIQSQAILRLNCPGYGQHGVLSVGGAPPLTNFKVIIVNAISVLHLFDAQEDIIRQIDISVTDGLTSFKLSDAPLLNKITADISTRSQEIWQFLESGGLLIYFLCRPFVVSGGTRALDNYAWLGRLAPDQSGQSSTSDAHTRHMSTVAHGRNVDKTQEAENGEFSKYFDQTGLEWNTIIRAEFLTEGYQSLAFAGPKKCIAGEMKIGNRGGRAVFLPAPYSPDFDRTLIDCVYQWHRSQSEQESSPVAQLLQPEPPTDKFADKSIDKPTDNPIEKPVEKPADKPSEKPVHKPQVTAGKHTRTFGSLIAQAAQMASASLTRSGDFPSSAKAAPVTEPAASQPKVSPAEQAIPNQATLNQATPKAPAVTQAQPIPKAPTDHAQPVSVQPIPKAPAEQAQPISVQPIPKAPAEQAQPISDQPIPKAPAEQAQPISVQPIPKAPSVANALPNRPMSSAAATTPATPSQPATKAIAPIPSPPASPTQPPSKGPVPVTPTASVHSEVEPAQEKPPGHKGSRLKEVFAEQSSPASYSSAPNVNGQETTSYAPRAELAEHEKLPATHQEENSGDNWANSYTLLGIDHLIEETHAVQAQIAQLERQIAGKQLMLGYLETLKLPLLSGKGGSVLESCKVPFDTLGWTSKPWRDKPGEFLVSENGQPVALARVSVSKGQAERTEIALLAESMINYWNEHTRELKGIFVACPFSDIPIEDRQQPDFSPAVIDFAKHKDICLITTVQLLYIYRDIGLNKVDAKALRQRILELSGALSGFIQ